MPLLAESHTMVQHLLAHTFNTAVPAPEILRSLSIFLVRKLNPIAPNYVAMVIS